jgi:hypothetical protein
VVTVRPGEPSSHDGPPPLRKGDRATCLFRGADVIVTSWTDAPLPWPRCRALGTRGGGSGLLVTEELVRAVRTESSAAVQHRPGVSEETVWRWRKAFGVAQWGTEGSRRLLTRTVAKAAAKTRGKRRSREHVRRIVATKPAQGWPRPTRWDKGSWTPEQLALLGTLPDEEVAARIGRSETAVRVKRNRLRIPRADQPS